MIPIVRPLERKDIPVLVFNDRRILGQSLGEEAFLAELDGNPFSRFFILEDSETKEFLGHIGIWIDPPLASILNFYVIPEKQHHGLGKILMDFIIRVLREEMVNTITLEVRQSNETAKTMYRQYGFKEVAIRKNYYSNGENADLMLKNIDLEK